MARRFCSQCGAAQKFLVQKFCTSCGAPFPDAAAPSGVFSGPGGRVWAMAIAAILIISILTVLLLPHIVPVITTPSAGVADVGNSFSLQQSPSDALPNGVTTVRPIVTPAIAVSQNATLTPGATVSPIRVTTLAQRTASIPMTIVPTMTPVPPPVTVITLAVTLVPQQPSSGSYVSNTTGALYLDHLALEGKVHELINAQRQKNGLSPLSYDPFLADIARGHSWDMVTRNFFEHVNPDGKNPRDRGDAAGYPCIRDMGSYTYEGIAENLFEGYRYSSYTTTNGVITSQNWSSTDEIAERTVNGWMNSPGHRANILTEHFILEGIGVAFSPDDRIFISENFC